MYSHPNTDYQLNEQFAQYLLSFFVNNYVEQDHYFGHNYASFIKEIELKFETPKFSVDWSLGGTYGSYNGDISPITPEIEPEMLQLDTFLMHAYPNINFMQYKILSHSIERTTETHKDWYNGRNNKAEKSLSFVDLSKALIKIKLEPSTHSIDKKDIINGISNTYSQDWFDATFPDTVKKNSTTKKQKKN